MNNSAHFKLANLSTEVLRSFVTVVEQDGFIRAADYLFKTQSTISQHIQRLEQELNTTLFMPLGRKRVLTPNGEIFLVYAKRWLKLQEEAQLALAQTMLEGEVRIGISMSMGEQFIPELLAQFAQTYPALRLLVDTGHSYSLIQGYHNGVYDLVVTLEREPKDGQILSEDSMVWIGRTAYEWNQQKPLPLAAYAPPCQFRDACTQALDQAGIAWQMIYSANSLNSLMASVGLGLAITVRASHTVIAETEILTPRLNLPSLPKIKIVLRNRNLTDAQRLVSEIITKQAFKIV
ncbi:LysR substrate-binding domain-containing protein [uncultured Thiothrix sp.]|uniref:LysR substrate-binding domain-containing protein n=1 Tax=uncultured Thiothrix sp. TaxID=223185 RepID=UPI0026231E15|nr:LysR substrate-binding domain-containing protein [uncultured Thiothrix sp.]